MGNKFVPYFRSRDAYLHTPLERLGGWLGQNNKMFGGATIRSITNSYQTAY
jgi:hypothetical protein